MRIIFLSLLTIVNSFIFPRHKSFFIIKNNCFDDEIIYLKNKISRLENIKNKMIELTNNNLRSIKEIIDEEYSTEWDFYNQTWTTK